MCKVVISAGSAHSMNIKTATIESKQDAAIFIAKQLNEILNNPDIRNWNISMQETRAILVH